MTQKLLRHQGRRVRAEFDGGAITSDAGGLLLGSTDLAIGVVDRFAACFVDKRIQELIERSVRTLVGQRVFAVALCYADLNDDDDLRHDRRWRRWPASWKPSAATARR